MKKYKGFVREIYEYEIEVDGEDAITSLKEFYKDPIKGNGIFLADANSLLRVDFSLRRGKQN